MLLDKAQEVREYNIIYTSSISFLEPRSPYINRNEITFIYMQDSNIFFENKFYFDRNNIFECDWNSIYLILLSISWSMIVQKK
jgi:hypothetical protein